MRPAKRCAPGFINILSRSCLSIHKTGCVSICRADTGLLDLPGDGGTIAYCAVADRLADQTMTALAERDEILGRLGAIVLARWRPGLARPSVPSIWPARSELRRSVWYDPPDEPSRG